MTDTATRRARNEQFWAQAAPGWIRHADRQDEVGRPLGAAALDWLNPQPGERFVDLGCGCGGTTADLATAVGRSGSALGLDLSEAMADAARRRFPPDRYPGLTFVAADIEALDVVRGAPFDGAFSRMMIMLLADPVAACATIRRSLRPGGRFAATVFRDGGVNPWLPAAMLGAAPFVGALPPLPIGDDPGPFAFADSAALRRVLVAAGFAEVAISAHDVTLMAPAEPDAVAEWLIELGPAGAAYRGCAADAQAQARAGAVRLLERFRQPDGGYHLPAGHWLVTATNPG